MSSAPSGLFVCICIRWNLRLNSGARTLAKPAKAARKTLAKAPLDRVLCRGLDGSQLLA